MGGQLVPIAPADIAASSPNIVKNDRAYVHQIQCSGSRDVTILA